MERQAVHDIYDKDGQHRRLLLLQCKNPIAVKETCSINEVQQGKLADQWSVKNLGNNLNTVGTQFNAFIQPKIPLLPKNYFPRKLAKPDKVIGKENAFRRGFTYSETCEPGVHPRPLQQSKESNVKPTPRILNKVSRRPSMSRKLDFDTTPAAAASNYLPSNEVMAIADTRVVPPVITEPVPVLGAVEEAQTHFAVVEVLVVHDNKPVQALPVENDVEIIGSEVNNVFPAAEQPLHEDNDTIRHYMRYEIVDGRRVKVYECGICRRGFKHQYTLMRHLPTHTDERNFPCQVCGKAFRQMSTLIQHGAIHSNARPYTCDVCQNTFNRVSTLISHKKTHSNDKPHLCTYCGKRFHQKGNLRNHIFTHTNERPYKCGMCDKGFNQKSNLICHRVRYHTAKQDYECEICKCKFPKKHALKNHQLYKHNIEYDSTKAEAAETIEGFPETDYVSSYRDSVVVVDCGENPDKKGIVPDLGMPTPLYLNNIGPDLDKLLAAGQVALILFKPMGASERLMKVAMDNMRSRPMLVPATLADLRAAHGGGCGDNETQFDVCTVATFYQKYDETGRLELAEAGYPAVCQIKVEPIVESLVVTKIQAWPSANGNSYASPFEYNPSSYQNNFNFPRFPSANHASLWHNPHSDYSQIAIDEDFNDSGFDPAMVDGEMITPELLDGIAGYMDDPAGYVDGFQGQLDALTGYSGVSGFGNDPLGGVAGFGNDDPQAGYVEYKYSSPTDGAPVQLSLETVEVASEPSSSFFPLM